MTIFASNTFAQNFLDRPPLGNPDGFLWGIRIGMSTTNSWTLNTVNLMLANYVAGGGTPPTGTVTIYIYAQGGDGFPTGSPLCSGEIGQGELVTIEWLDQVLGNGTIYPIAVTPNIEMTAGEGYVLVATASDYNSSGPVFGQTIIFQNSRTGGDGEGFGLDPFEYQFQVTNRLIKYISGSWSTGGGIGYGGSALIFQLDGTEIDPNAPPPPSDPPDDLSAFPPAKPDLPNADPWWNPPDPSGSSPPGPLPPYWATGGGGYQKNLVVSGNNKIYYEAHTEFTVPYTP